MSIVILISDNGKLIQISSQARLRKEDLYLLGLRAFRSALINVIVQWGVSYLYRNPFCRNLIVLIASLQGYNTLVCMGFVAASISVLFLYSHLWNALKIHIYCNLLCCICQPLISCFIELYITSQYLTAYFYKKI